MTPLAKTVDVLTKALVTAEGSVRLTYPDLGVVWETRYLAPGLVLKRYKPEMVLRRISQAILNFSCATACLPAMPPI